MKIRNAITGCFCWLKKITFASLMTCLFSLSLSLNGATIVDFDMTDIEDAGTLLRNVDISTAELYGYSFDESVSGKLLSSAYKIAEVSGGATVGLGESNMNLSDNINLYLDSTVGWNVSTSGRDIYDASSATTIDTFLVFRKDMFAERGDRADATISFDSRTQISTTYSGLDRWGRIALKQSDQWYLSEESDKYGIIISNFNNSVSSDKRWAKIYPTATDFNVSRDIASLTFEAVDFTNVTAVASVIKSDRGGSGNYARLKTFKIENALVRVESTIVDFDMTDIEDAGTLLRNVDISTAELYGYSFDESVSGKLLSSAYKIAEVSGGATVGLGESNMNLSDNINLYLDSTVGWNVSTTGRDIYDVSSATTIDTFLVFRKDMFAEQGDRADATISFDSRTQISTTYSGLDRWGRIALKQSDQWYLSEESDKYGIIISNFNNSASSGKRWAKVYPTATDFNVSRDIASLTFEAVDFTNVTAVASVIKSDRGGVGNYARLKTFKIENALVCLALNTSSKAGISLDSSLLGIDRPNWQDNLQSKISIVEQFDVQNVRISMDYRQAASELQPAMDALNSAGIKPVVLVEYYKYYGDLKNNGTSIYDYWFNLGHSIAQLYGNQISYYTAINEPDLYLWVENGSVVTINDSRAIIPLNDFYDAIKGFADGIHSVDTSYKVFPGGLTGWLFHNDFTNRGYSSVLAPLFNDGTLDGLDLHSYANDLSNYNFSAQYIFQKTKENSGITADINYYCTEFNCAGTDGFLTAVWDQLGVVGNNGERKTVFTMPYSLFALSSQVGVEGVGYGMASDLDPWTAGPRAEVWELLLPIMDGAEFVALDPWNTGTYTLKSNDKKIWVWQNRSAYSKIASTSFALTRIPADATKVDVYLHDSVYGMPYQTIALDGRQNLMLDNLPQDETIIFVTNGTNDSSFTELLLDFDGGGAPTEVGYMSFKLTTYTPTTGYGWGSSYGVLARDRELGGPLFQDIHMDNDPREFLVDVAPGEYRIRLHIGDQQYAKNNIDVVAEGQLIFDNVSTVAGETVTLEFDIVVDDGQLTIEFSAEEGYWWSVAGFELEML